MNWREMMAGLCVVLATVIVTGVAIALANRGREWLDKRAARLDANAQDAEWRRREAEIEAYRQAAIDAYQNN